MVGNLCDISYIMKPSYLYISDITLGYLIQ